MEGIMLTGAGRAISLFLGRMPALTELPIDYSTDFGKLLPGFN
jgi:hypothetical protein